MSNKRKIMDYIVKNKEIFIGLEDSKTTWVLCVRAGREIIHQVSMPARYGALREYLRHCPASKGHEGSEAAFNGSNLFDAPTGDGYNTTVVPPHTVHQEKCARVKNDRIDANLLAKNLEDGNCKACHVPDKERREDRQVVRTLGTIVKEVVRTKNQIRKLCDFHGIETGISVKNWKKVHYLHVKSLVPGFSSSLRLTFDKLFDDLEHFWKQQKAYKAALAALTKKERYAKTFTIATSLPGIGDLTAIRLILELGEDFERFRTGSEIAAFVGLGGTEHSSGQSERKGGITKQGNAQIRSWLIESAWVAIRHDPALREFYSRIRLNTGNAKKAIVAVARKLVVRLRCCIVSNTEYLIGVIE